MKKTISVIVPVFRNASTLKELHQNINDVFKIIPQVQLHLLFVDDGSDDESLSIIEELRKKDQRVQFLSFTRNFGQVAAIIAGFRTCTNNASILISADLQDPPEMILKMVKAWEEGAQIVICHRSSRGDKLLDRLFSQFFYSVVRLIYPKIPLGGFDFFLLDYSVIIEFNNISKKGRFIQGDVIQLTGNKSFLPYNRISRKSGKSQWTLIRKLKYAFDGLTYSNKSLWFISIFGFVWIALSFTLCISYKIDLLLESICSLIGISLLIIGMTGFLYRSWSKTKDKDPMYVINKNS